MESESLVIIPTYNEIENIEQLISVIHEKMSTLSILVVDDGSPDGTGRLVAKLKENNPRIHLIEREGKLGLGTAYIAGFKYAISKGFRFVFEMDADFSHNPKYLPALLAGAVSNDLAIGSRYVEGGGVEDWGTIRRLVSKGGSLYSRIILGVPYRDLTGGFKCFKVSALEKIDLDSVHSEGYSFQIEMTYKLHKNGAKIVEIPIIFSDRLGGVSKMSWTIFAEAILRVWQMRFAS